MGDQKGIRIGSSVIMLTKVYGKNSILLFERKTKGKIKYLPIGGGMELYENSKTAIHREVKEETGLWIPEEEFEYLTTFELIIPEEQKHRIVIMYVTWLNYGIDGFEKLITLTKEHKGFKVFNLNLLPKNIGEIVKPCIKLCKQRKIIK